MPFWPIFLHNWIDWLKDATLTSMSTSSVNVQFVAGEGGIPAVWTVKRQDESFGCEVSNRAHLKDCTTFQISPGSSELHLGGYAQSTTWFSKIVPVTLLALDRKFGKYCSIAFNRHYKRILYFILKPRNGCILSIGAPDRHLFDLSRFSVAPSIA